jgi:hypothetical protein
LGEVKKMRCHRRQLPECVDSATKSQELAANFAVINADSYSSVLCSESELGAKSMKITDGIKSNRLVDDYQVEVSEVYETVSQLKSIKSEGLCSWSSDFFLLTVLLK